MIIKSFKQFESIIEYDYANKEISNKIKDGLTSKKDIQYENQGWFRYKGSMLDVHSKNPPKNGEYDVRNETRMDTAIFKNGKFQDSKIYGLKDSDIKYWKIRQSDDSEHKYSYNEKTGKWERGNKIKRYEPESPKPYSEMDKTELKLHYNRAVGSSDIDELRKIIKYM
ncbi:MAG: hypothetical protein ACOC3V_03740 [bacterium]